MIPRKWLTQKYLLAGMGILLVLWWLWPSERLEVQKSSFDQQQQRDEMKQVQNTLQLLQNRIESMDEKQEEVTRIIRRYQSETRSHYEIQGDQKDPSQRLTTHQLSTPQYPQVERASIEHMPNVQTRPLHEIKNPQECTFKNGELLGMVSSPNLHSTMIVSGTRGAGSGCYVSEEYKFIFVHVLKSGGSAIKSWLEKALCGNESSGLRNCKSRVLREETCKPALQRYRGVFFIWTFVRNPYRRFLSNWGMSNYYIVNKKLGDQIPFEEFAANPTQSVMGRSKISVVHFNPQSNFVVDRVGCPVVDYIGKLETIQQDMEQIMAHIDCLPMAEFWLKHNRSMPPGGGGNAFGSKQLRANDLQPEDMFTPATQQLVYDRYCLDFERFGYDRDDFGDLFGPNLPVDFAQAKGPR